jgi:hypothetical protein
MSRSQQQRNKARHSPNRHGHGHSHSHSHSHSPTAGADQAEIPTPRAATDPSESMHRGDDGESEFRPRGLEQTSSGSQNLSSTLLPTEAESGHIVEGNGVTGPANELATDPG